MVRACNETSVCRGCTWLLGTLCALLPTAGSLAWTPYLQDGEVWRRDVVYALHMPGTRHVDPSFPSELSRAVEAWTSIACAELRVRYAGTTAAMPNVSPDGADSLSVIGFEERTWPHGEGVTAVTRVRAKDGAIVEADMLLNAVDYEWRVGAVPEAARRLRALAFTLPHELGHFWGLGHSDDPTSLMHATARHSAPGSDDVQALCTLYPKREQAHDGSRAPVAEDGLLTSRVRWGVLAIASILMLWTLSRALQRGARRLKNRP